MSDQKKEVAALLLITLLAAILRFYRLTEIPPGLHFDEGFKGLTARALLSGAPLQIFFKGDMGEEPLSFYLVTASLALVGQKPWAVRLPSALVGTLTVPLVWWLGREIWLLHPRPASRRAGRAAVGLLSALVLSILYWHLTFSRTAMQAILVPFFVTLAFAALLRGLRRGGQGWFALAGLALGGSLYTYKAGYFVPPLAALFVAYAALVERGFLRRRWRGLLLAALVALLVAAPLGLYFATHPADFMQRPASVAVTGDGGPGQALAANLPRVLGLFFSKGDANPRSNLPGRPALDPFLALLFLIGLGRALLGLRRPAFALLPLWLAVMLLPTLLTEHAPHFGRAIGATPALAVLGALGGWEVGRWGSGRSGRSKWGGRAAAALLGAGFVFSGASAAWTYFDTWGRSPDLFYAYDVGLAEVAGYINARPADEDVYLTPTPREHFTLAFLVDREFSAFDGRAGLVYPPPGRAATVVVIVYEDAATLPALQAARPDGRVVWTLADGYGRPYAVAYHLPARPDPAPPPDHPAEAVLGRGVRLLGYDWADGEGRLTLYWQALAPLTEDYTVFTHLLGGYNAATGGPLWAGHDGQPDGGHYPTTAWQPGQVILDVHPLALPADAPPGEYTLEAGLYLLATMERLPAADAQGNPLPDNAVRLGTIRRGE